METTTFRNLQWIYVEQTSYRDVEFLEERYHFHPLDLKDCIGITQRPKLDVYDDYLFLVFHFPYYHREQRKIRIRELNVFIGSNYLITLTNERIPALAEYFQEYRTKLDHNPTPNNLRNSSGYLMYKILDRLFTTAQPVLEIIDEQLAIAEDEVFRGSKRHTAMNLSIIRRCILSYQRILEPQLRMVDKLVKLQRHFLQEELTVYYDDIHDGLERVWSALNTAKETVEGLDRTNETLLSQKLNEIIKTLTVISVVTIVPGLIINFFGMNVGLPFAGHPKAVLLITGTLAIIMVTTYFVLKRHRLT